MTSIRQVIIPAWRAMIIVSVLVVLGVVSPLAQPGVAALPAGAWWLVIHNQCADTLHWIYPAGAVREHRAAPAPG